MTLKLSLFPVFCAAFGFSAVNAHAQMAVTTFGATDAVQCFQNASNDLSRDAGPCDSALRDGATTRKDRRKTLVNRGIIHNRNGDLTAAIDDFNAALEQDPGLAEAYLNRGNSWFLSGRLDDALADYEEALSRDISKSWVVWYNIGLVHDARNEREAAREAYEKSLALNPDFSLARAKLDAPE